MSEEQKPKLIGKRKLIFGIFIILATGLFVWLLPEADPKIFETVVIYTAISFFGANAFEYMPKIMDYFKKKG